MESWPLSSTGSYLFFFLTLHEPFNWNVGSLKHLYIYFFQFLCFCTRLTSIIKKMSIYNKIEDAGKLDSFGTRQMQKVQCFGSLFYHIFVS